jgi:hypothetical protein
MTVPTVWNGGVSTTAPAVWSGGAIEIDSTPAADSLRNPFAASDAAEGAGPPTSPPWPSTGYSNTAASGTSAMLDEAPASTEAAITDAAALGTSASKKLTGRQTHAPPRH